MYALSTACVCMCVCMRGLAYLIMSIVIWYYLCPQVYSHRCGYIKKNKKFKCNDNGPVRSGRYVTLVQFRIVERVFKIALANLA